VRRTFTARAAASVILAGALLLGTSGCTFISTQATLIEYDPSDGVGANIGNVQVRNVFGLISEDERAVSLVITLVNSGSRSASVKIQYETGGEKTTVTKPVNANSVATYGTTPDEDQIVILNPGVKAGQLLPVYVQYGDHEGKQLMVPILHPVGDYEELAPPEIER
jgi:hypothetical protein